MPARYKDTVRSIVKSTLNIGLVSDFDDFQTDRLADPEDIIEIIDEVERIYRVEFSDGEHFRSKSIDTICKILSDKEIDDSMLLSFGGPIENVQ